jgi:hypothetical protein
VVVGIEAAVPSCRTVEIAGVEERREDIAVEQRD